MEYECKIKSFIFYWPPFQSGISDIIMVPLLACVDIVIRNAQSNVILDLC